ncbi:MAG: serine hydrolase [candidate division Zixibacteria bacterium]|nr:serine hydrolase [candidate division Zixibacteria bacterium]
MEILRVISVLAILVLTGCNQSERTTDMPIDVALQKALDESIVDSGVKGVSAAIIFPDGEMWKGTSGISHEGVPVTADMLFDIGSIEKTFQATLALQLAEEGLISLDDPLEKWFPAYPNIDGKITISQLLNMTSGLDKIVEDANSPWRIGYENIDFDRVWTWEDLYNTFITEPNFEPGDKCEYSTTNYIVLKHIIEKATRSTQTVEFENRIMRPYGLKQTLVDFSKPAPESLPIVHGWCDIDADGKADDISGNSLAWLASISPMLVYSTPSDMVRWIDALFHKRTVLKAETLEAMLTFHRPVQNEPMMHGYGLGVVDINWGAFLPKWKDVKLYGHLGSQFGYSTFVGYCPELAISVSIMFNRGCDQETNRAVGTVSGAFFDVLFRRLGVKELSEQGSVSDMIKELKKSPDDVHLMYKIARMHQAKEDDYEAMLMYEEILKRDPEDKYGYRLDALFWKVSYDGLIFKKPEGLISFIADHPDYKDIQGAYKWLAKTYKRRDEIARAVEVYKEAIQKFGEDAYFLNHVAWWVFENKVESEYATAVSYAEKAIALHPEECSIWDTLAWLYFVSGRQEKAIEASAKALSLAPEDEHDFYEEQLKKIKKGR